MKYLIIAIIIVVVGFFAYKYTRQTNQQTQSSLTTNSPIQANKQIVSEFFAKQNTHASPDSFKSLFAANYHISDVGTVDVPKNDQVDISKRIAAFQQKFPGYNVDVHNMIAEDDKVFVWFSVQANNKLILDSFVIFTLQNSKIIKAVEMVKMQQTASH